MRNSFQPQQNIERKRGFINSRINKFTFKPVDIEKNIVKNQPKQNSANYFNIQNTNDLLLKQEQEKQIELNLLKSQLDINEEDEQFQQQLKIETVEQQNDEQLQLKLKPWYQILCKKEQDNSNQDSSESDDEQSNFNFCQNIQKNQISNQQKKQEKYRKRIEFVQNCFQEINDQCDLMNKNKRNEQNTINLQKIDLQKFENYLRKLTYKYHGLEKKEQILLKNISLYVLSMNSFQTMILNLQYLDQICLLILEMILRDEIESRGDEEIDTQVYNIIMIAQNIIDSYTQSFKQAIYFCSERKQNLKIEDSIRFISLFRVDNKQISFVTVILFRIVQSLAITLQQQNEDICENYNVFEIIAKVVQSIVIYIFDCSFKENDNAHESFLILQYIFKDFVTLLSDQIDGAPVQYPVFSLFFKAFSIKLLQSFQEILMDSNDRKKSQKDQTDEINDIDDDNNNNYTQQQKFELLDIFKKLMLASNGLLSRLRKWSSVEKNNCICQYKYLNIKQEDSEQFIVCTQCQQPFHISCYIGKELNQSKNYNCLKCFFKNDFKSNTLNSQKLRIKSQDQFFELVNIFYTEYQSSYFDFSSAQAMSLQVQQNYCIFQDFQKNGQIKLQKIQEQIKNHISDLKQNKKQNKENKIIGHTQLINTNLIRLYGSILFAKEELESLFETMKQLLANLCCSKQAVIRQKTINIFKNLIKADPIHLLKDSLIQNAIRLKIEDPSSIARESALDIINQNLEILTEIGLFYQENLNQNNLIGMIIERSHTDMNIGVRKKIIQILSQILDFNIDTYENNQKTYFMNLKQEIIMILIVRWSDSNGNVRQSLVKSIQKIIKQSKKSQNSQSLNVLFEIVKQWCSFNKSHMPQQMENMMQLEIEDIVQIVWEVLECEKIKLDQQESCLVCNLSELIIQSSINRVYQALEDNQENQQLEIFSCVRFIQIISEIYPKAVREQIKGVLDLQIYLQDIDYQSTPLHLLFCKIFLDCLKQSETEQSNSDEITDWMTPQYSKQISEFTQKSVNIEPLVNMQFSIDLLIRISMINQDVKFITQIVVFSIQMLSQFQEERLNQSKNSAQISRAIIILSLLITRFPEQQKLNKVLNINLENEFCQNLLGIFSEEDKIKESLFDMTLLGLSIIWLNSDEQLMSLDKESKIFQKVYFRFKQVNYLNPITKSMIIQTFINMIQKVNITESNDGQSTLQYLNRKMTMFLDLMPDKFECTNSKFRFSLVNLHSQMYLKGMIQPTHIAAQKWIIMQSDFDENILVLAQRQLERISLSRIDIIQQTMNGVKEIIEGLYEWQINCGIKTVSGFKRIVNQQGETMEYNYGILDCLIIHVVAKQNKKMVNLIIQKWVMFGINTWAHNYEDTQDSSQFTKQIKMIIFYGELIFTLLKHVQILKNQNDEEDIFNSKIESLPILKILQDFCMTNEIQIYKNLKHNDKQKSLSQGLVLLILKQSISQLLKQLKQTKSKKNIEDQKIKYCLESKQILDNVLHILKDHEDQGEETTHKIRVQVLEQLREAIKDKEIKEEKRWVTKLTKNMMIKQGLSTNKKNKDQSTNKKRTRNQFLNETFKQEDEYEESNDEDDFEYDCQKSEKSI